MSIEQTNVIDFAGVDLKTGKVRLAISDHLPWDEKGLHLKLLQDKLNAYLEFIEGGQLQEKHPESIGHQPVIHIFGKYPLSEKAKFFLDKATKAIRDLGFDLVFTQIKSDQD